MREHSEDSADTISSEKPYTCSAASRGSIEVTRQREDRYTHPSHRRLALAL